MAKFDNAKAIEKQKEFDALSTNKQLRAVDSIPPVSEALRKMDLLSDDYGTAANPSALRAGKMGMLDKDVPQSKYFETRQNIAREAAAEQRREANRPNYSDTKSDTNFKKGGKVKASSASKRADGIATKGKTRGRIV